MILYPISSTENNYLILLPWLKWSYLMNFIACLDVTDPACIFTWQCIKDSLFHDLLVHGEVSTRKPSQCSPNVPYWHFARPAETSSFRNIWFWQVFLLIHTNNALSWQLRDYFIVLTLEMFKETVVYEICSIYPETVGRVTLNV